MKNPGLISVLMTAFNRENYIADAIESVLASTYRDFELIIVDDCSTDKTVEIIRNYELRDDRIRIFVNEENLGDYPNRNRAASYARGEYLKYLDSDDTMAPNCLERMVIEMNRNPACAFGVSSRHLEQVAVHDSENAFRIHFFIRGILDLGPSYSIIRKDVFVAENGFGELRCVSDFEFWLRLALKYPMLELEKDLVHWRDHGQQEISYNSHIEQSLKFVIPIIQQKLAMSLLSEYEQKCILKKYKKGTIRYLLKNIKRIGIVDFFEFKSLNNINLLDAF